MSNNTIADLRATLMDTLRDLRNRDNPMDIDRAKAVAQVASVLVDTARVEVEFIRVTDAAGTGFIGNTNSTKQLQTTAAEPGSAAAPFGITRHRLVG